MNLMTVTSKRKESVWDDMEMNVAQEHDVPSGDMSAPIAGYEYGSQNGCKHQSAIFRYLERVSMGSTASASHS